MFGNLLRRGSRSEQHTKSGASTSPKAWPAGEEPGEANGAAELTEARVMETLAEVVDPELHRSIVELNMVRGVRIRNGTVEADIALTIPGCPMRATIESRVKEKLLPLPGVKQVVVNLGTMTEEERQAVIAKVTGQSVAERRKSPLADPASKTMVICIASGKGGVGKSSVTANLAAALVKRGHSVGVLDADVYGFSIPRMLGVSGRPTMIDHMLIPLEKDGLRVLSMGHFVDEDQAVLWRGPMLHKFVRQLLVDVYWNDPDFLLIDLPPGTGDVGITISGELPGAGLIVVTTPQRAASTVAGRVAELLVGHGRMRLLGVVENMSYFTTPSGERIPIFGEGEGQRLAARLGVPLLAQIPIDVKLREGGDSGRPVVFLDESSEAAQAFTKLAERVVALAQRKPMVLPVVPS
jgi:ATP-binding protein involved in chromosome partitioning